MPDQPSSYRIPVDFYVFKQNGQERHEFFLGLQHLYNSGALAGLGVVEYTTKPYNAQPKAEPTQIHPTIVNFASDMSDKITAKSNKTHWSQQPIEALIKLMLLEIEEFKVAYEYFGANEARKELVDVANYAMIVWDRLRSLPEPGGNNHADCP